MSAEAGALHQESGDAAIDWTQWHTFTQEWSPGVRRYYLDGNLIETTTQPVYSGIERWQLQVEGHDTGATGAGHILVDWAAVYEPG